MLIDWKLVGQNSKLTKVTIFLFFFLIIGLQIFLTTQISSNTPMIVSIDVKAIIAEFIKQQEMHAIHEKQEKQGEQEAQEKKGKKELDINQLSQLIENFSVRLSHEINKKAKEDNLVFVPKQAVIAGSKDYTDIIKNQVLKGA